MDNEVRKLLEEYNTEFIKFRRNVEDALENIDLDNLSPRVKAYITKSGAARAGFEVGGLSDGAYARMFAEFKNARDKAFAEFKAEVSSKYATVEMLSEYQASTSTAIASIQATADVHGSSISNLTEWKGTANTALENINGSIQDLDTDIGVLSESFTEIEQKADANGAFIKLMVGQAVKLVGSDLKGMDDNQAVTSASAADFVMEAANGESTIKLRADRIKLGEGAGVYGDGNLYLCKLFGPSNVASGSYPGQFYLEVDSSFNFSEDSVGADMLMKSVSSIDSYTGTEAVMYGFRYGSTKGNEGTSSVNFVVAAGTDGSEKSVIGYNYNQDKVYPKGAWDFSSAQVSGLVVRFS